MSVKDAAYIAGLIDGEGTITLQRKHRNENRRLAITIASTERQMLEFVLEVSGVGTITSKKTYQPHHAKSFTYAVYSRQALSLLKQIQIYLLSYKKKRGELILKEYLQLTPRNGKYSASLKAQRTEFEEKFLGIKPHQISEPGCTYYTCNLA